MAAKQSEQESLLETNTLIRKVEELIDPATGGWDVQLLHEIFCPTDVRMITAIPLSPWMEDSIAWHGNRNGMFSVRSAYHMEWQHQYGSQARRREAGN
jgi:hypothetical protein